MIAKDYEYEPTEDDAERLTMCLHEAGYPQGRGSLNLGDPDPASSIVILGGRGELPPSDVSYRAFALVVPQLLACPECWLANKDSEEVSTCEHPLDMRAAMAVSIDD